MKEHILIAGMNYEAFICRAHKCDYGRLGAKSDYFTNLLEIEDGRDLSFLSSPKKQLEAIKKYLDKAFTAFLKRKLTQEEKQSLVHLQGQINSVKFAKEIIPLVSQAVEITQRFKEYDLQI